MVGSRQWCLGWELSIAEATSKQNKTKSTKKNLLHPSVHSTSYFLNLGTVGIFWWVIGFDGRVVLCIVGCVAATVAFT